ncbi:MAG TPA: PLP-dependent aminotransferase family protein [Chloroflexi bacterium]|nr:PLP-dependent aminotransferase family protein [Chloroflexota bacterium]
MLGLSLERDSQEPIYLQIKRQLAYQIENNILTPGDRLPATRDLAAELGVSRISVVAAYEELKAEGYISAHVGRGTFVAAREVALPEAGSGALAGTARSQDAALRGLLRLAERPGVINFSQGTPAESFLPVALMRWAIDSVLDRDGGAAIAYEVTEGYPPLRRAVAGMVASQGIEVSADEVLITGGCQQALDLAVQALLNQGDVLLTSNPTYAGILDIARARGVTPVGVPVDAEGMRTEALEALIIEHRPRLIYIAPTYHNPTGTVMPLHRRRHLLELAARYRLPVLEDGVYENLTYAGSPPPPLKALDREGLVLYASSFSKVLLPGMRIGYLLAAGQLYRRLARVKGAADICTPALNQRAIHLALESGRLIEHVAEVRAVCRARRDAMLAALERHLSMARWHEPAGGLYLWVELPSDGPTATELYLHAVRAGVAFAMGPLFYTDGQGAYHLRLNMVAYPPDTIEEGVRRLGAAWRELAAGYQPPERTLSTTPVL